MKRIATFGLLCGFWVRKASGRVGLSFICQFACIGMLPSTARRKSAPSGKSKVKSQKSKGASALGGSADLFAQRLPFSQRERLAPREKQLAFKSQKSKVLRNELFRIFKWLLYLRRVVLAHKLMTPS